MSPCNGVVYRAPDAPSAVVIFSVRYWVAVRNGRVDFGVGDVGGLHTVLSYQDEDTPIEVRYEFISYTALVKRWCFSYS